MRAQDAPTGLRRRVVSTFLAVMLVVLGIDGLPRVAAWSKLEAAQDALVRWSDPAIVGLGLWQGRWELYAPSPDSINVALTGVVRFEDGLEVEWRSPDWRSMSWRAKFRMFRHAEYVDGTRRDHNSGMWAPLARYLARTIRHPADDSLRPSEVELWRRWVVIPEPAEPLRPFADPFPLAKKYMFHLEEFE